MRVITKAAEFSIFELFIHGFSVNCPVDDYALEDILDERLRELVKETDSVLEVRVVSPAESGLRRWSVRWREPVHEKWQRCEHRVYKVSQFKKWVPKEIVEAMEQMDEETMEVH